MGKGLNIMATNRRKSTKTSAFGTPGRFGHDSSEFYNSKLYSNASQENITEYKENQIPSDVLDIIQCKSSENMNELPDDSVHLMVTSPPYNVGKEYDENLTLEEYLKFLNKVWSETYRVLVPGGRACVNIANLGRKPRRDHTRGCQDQAKAHGQDPRAVLPDHRG